MSEIGRLWAEKYRPKTIDEYVFKDDAQRRQIKAWVKDGSIPHLLFSGSAGIGKTTLAKVLLNELEVGEYDILEMNASRENNVDTVRDKIINFVQMIPFGPFKVVLLDEADYLTPSAQAVLRGVMETYSDHSRFILTCNYPNRIIPALHSRCQGFHFTKGDQDEFTARIGDILIKEGVDLNEETVNLLDTYVKLTFPDFRKCINRVQQNIVDGKLMAPTAGDSDSADYKIEMVELFKQGKIEKARELLCGRARPEEMQEIYTWMYQNLKLFGDTDDKRDSAVLIIKQGLVDHALCADAEINLAAVLIKLARNYHA
jgi:replication factor C small subunit